VCLASYFDRCLCSRHTESDSFTSKEYQETEADSVDEVNAESDVADSAVGEAEVETAGEGVDEVCV
jgi:hypothetical protein